MYTQMGFVSATNILHLFEIQKDIMIGFAGETKLSRNGYDSTLMDVQVPVAGGG